MSAVDSGGHGAGLIFVSHRKADKDFVEEKLAEIEGRGLSPDPVHVPARDERHDRGPLEQALWANLSASQVVLFFLTPSSLESNWCFAELALARALGKPTLTLRRGADDLLHP